MRQKININDLSGSDRENASLLLKEIAKLRELKKDACAEIKEELQVELMELVCAVNNIINQGKQVIKTINHN